MNISDKRSGIYCKSLNEKLEIIEGFEAKNFLIEDDIKMLDILSKDKESEVRARVAEVLVISKSLDAEKILVRLLSDKTVLVRTNACDSLCNSISVEVLNFLKDRTVYDRSDLLRGYAALSIADIAISIGYDFQELSHLFFNLLESEKSDWVKINYYKVLFQLGNESYLNKLIIELNNKSYRNRLAVINILYGLCTDETIFIIKSALNERKRKEKAPAVKSLIECTLSKIS